MLSFVETNILIKSALLSLSSDLLQFCTINVVYTFCQFIKSKFYIVILPQRVNKLSLMRLSQNGVCVQVKSIKVKNK